MARRRLNKKVFAVLMGVLVISGSGVLLWAMFRGGSADPRQLEAQGDEFFARADYKHAQEAYGQALGKDLKNGQLRLKLGETLIKRTREGSEFLDMAHDQWRRAINDNPRFTPAMQKLIQSEFEQIDLTGGQGKPEQLAMVFNDIRTRADQYLAVEPNNTQAQTWRHLATVRQWQMTKSIPQEDLDKSIAALSDIVKRDPSNAEAVFYLASTKAAIGKDFLNANDKKRAADSFGESADVVKLAITAQPKNADLQYRAHLIYGMLSHLDPKAEERKHQEKAGESIAAAAANVTEKVKDYDLILLRWADWQLMQNKPAEARKIRQKLYEDHPNNQYARISWAALLKDLSKEDRAKAIEILTKEIPLPPDVVGAGALRHRDLQARTLMDLIKIHLADYQQETDAAKKTKSMASAEAALDRLKGMINSPRAPGILFYEGKVLLAKERGVEAVQAFEDAYRQYRPGSKDYDLIWELAKTYADKTGQPGSARRLCEEIVNDNPTGWYPARAMLVRLLIAENKMEQARVHLETLRRQNKDYYELRTLDMMAFVGPSMDPLKAAQILPSLPERDPKDPDNVQKTMQALALKYEIAQRADKQDVQIDVLNKMIPLDPKNIRLVGPLVQLYKQREWNDRALATVDRALLANPDDATLKLLRLELTGTPAAELRVQIRKQIELNNKDPFTLQMRLYELERTPGGDWQAGIDHLKEAEKIRPDDKGIQEILFKEFLAHGDLDKAKAPLDRLVRMNADNVGGRLFRHRLAKEQGDFAQAERLGRELTEQYPQFALSWFALGQAQMGLGKFKEAIGSFTEVLARQPTNYDANRGITDAFYYDGQTDKAEVKLREMHTALFPQDPVVRELYLNHLANFGKPEQAIPERKEILAKNPKDPRAYLSLAATYFKNAQRLALENRQDETKKNIESAFEILSRGREQFPDDTRFYAQVAEIHQYNGKLDQAEQVLKEYANAELAKPPEKVRADPWLALAEFYMRAAQTEKAVDAMNEALVRSKNDLETRLRLVSVMVQAKQFADASRTLDAVRDNPDPRIRRQRLEILIAQGSLQEAEREVRAELTKRDAPELRNLLGSVLIDTSTPEKNRIEEAIAELNRALSMDHSNEASRYLRALAYAKRPAATLTQLQQNQEQAINELIELDKTQRNQVQTRLLLAELYEKTGKRKQGIAKLEDSLKKNPGSRETRLTLVRMYRSERPPNFKDAHEKVAEAEKDPVLKTDPTWHREAALLYQDQRLVFPAIQKMNEALRLAPGNNEYRRQFLEMLIRFNDFAGALIQTDQLLRNGVDNWWLRMQRGVAIGRQVNANMLQQAKTDPKVAASVKETQGQSLAEFDKALSMVSNDLERTMLILRSMGETVGYDPALQRVAPKLTNDPNNDWKILTLAMKRAKGDFAGAIADGERMLVDPANGKDKPDRRKVILRALADVYQNQNPPDFFHAKERYIELLNYDRDDLVSLNNLAYILAELVQPTDPQAAKIYSKRAFDITLTQNEPDPSIRDTHGWVLVLCGGQDLQAGMLILRKVVEHAPNLAEAHYHLGEAYNRLQRAGDAEKELAEAMRLMDEEEKLGMKVDKQLRDRVQTSLAKTRELLKIRPAA